MLKRALIWLLFSSAAMAQTQYGTAPKPGSLPHPGVGCPWLTSGSAAHTLGGEVSVTAKVTNTGEGSCSFSRQQSPPDSLEVLVSRATLAVCPADSTGLKGIGNEALTCRLNGSRNEAVEMISSRVRDLHFTVTLTARGRKTTTKPADPHDDALEQIAEQVAGNLY
jgi:hypothetical protein